MLIHCCIGISSGIRKWYMDAHVWTVNYCYYPVLWILETIQRRDAVNYLGIICRLRPECRRYFGCHDQGIVLGGGCLAIMVNVFVGCCSDAAIRAELTDNELMNRRMIMNAITGTRWYDYCVGVMLSLCALCARWL